MRESIEPLIPWLWFERIEKIAHGGLGNVENALRHAGHLLQLTPAPFRDVVGPDLDEKEFEALLDAGDHDTAARRLVGLPTILSVEAEPREGALCATISCPMVGRAIRGSGDTVASAILDAWTSRLLGLRTKYGADSLPDLRQFEPRRQAG